MLPRFRSWKAGRAQGCSLGPTNLAQAVGKPWEGDRGLSYSQEGGMGCLALCPLVTWTKLWHRTQHEMLVWAVGSAEPQSSFPAGSDPPPGGQMCLSGAFHTSPVPLSTNLPIVILQLFHHLRQ